jgi:hypothetical protein
MAVTLNASTTTGLVQSADTSGSLNIQSNGTTVLGVTSTGTSVTGTQSVSGNLSFNSGYGSSAVAYGCRAWVNFNGTGTVAIRASGNVSSITDNGTGDYTVNFTTAMPDANYSVSGSSSCDTTSHYSYIGVLMNISGSTSPSAFQTSSIRFIVRNEGGTNTIDSANLSLAVFR